MNEISFGEMFAVQPPVGLHTDPMGWVPVQPIVRLTNFMVMVGSSKIPQSYKHCLGAPLTRGRLRPARPWQSVSILPFKEAGSVAA